MWAQSVTPSDSQLRSPHSVHPATEYCIPMCCQCGRIPFTSAGACSAWTLCLACHASLVNALGPSSMLRIPHVILESARGSEMRMRKEGASGRRISQGASGFRWALPIYTRRLRLSGPACRLSPQTGIPSCASHNHSLYHTKHYFTSSHLLAIAT